MRLKNKNIIITGGAGGIGKSFVVKVKDYVGSIAVIDINAESINEMKNSIESENIIYYNTDISVYDELKKNIEDYYSIKGEIHCLVNCAAILIDQPIIRLSISDKSLKKLSIDKWDKVIKTNLYGACYASVEVAEKMILSRTKGVIVNVSSISSAGNSGQSSYAASKAALNALTVTWAQELNNFKIRVNCVAPGMTNTNMPINAMSKDHLDYWKKQVPLKRFAEPDEIAEAIIFCINNEYFNGRVIEIDGGLRF